MMKTVVIDNEQTEDWLRNISIKHLPGQHVQQRHAGTRGNAKQQITDSITATREYLDDRDIEDMDIYVDREAKSISSARSPEEMKAILGEPVRTDIIFGKPETKLHHNVLFNHLEEKAGVNQSLQSVLDNELTTAKTQAVPLKDVIISQKYIFEKPLLDYVGTKQYNESELYLVHHKDKYFVNDNNHRVAAAKLNDEESLQFKILEIPS